MSMASKKLVAVSAGSSEASSTTRLVGRVISRAIEQSAAHNMELTAQVIELRPLAKAIAEALATQFVSRELQEALDAVGNADALIAAAPVYQAVPSGLFTSFFQVMDDDALIGTPTLLAATAGSVRHALVVDDQMRGSFAYLRALAVPTGLFAAPEDWGAGLTSRIDRACVELLALVQADFRGTVRGASWGSYQHTFDSAGSDEAEIDPNTDLMRLATGG